MPQFKHPDACNSQTELGNQQLSSYWLEEGLPRNRTRVLFRAANSCDHAVLYRPAQRASPAVRKLPAGAADTRSSWEEPTGWGVAQPPRHSHRPALRSPSAAAPSPRGTGPEGPRGSLGSAQRARARERPARPPRAAPAGHGQQGHGRPLGKEDPACQKENTQYTS